MKDHGKNAKIPKIITCKNLSPHGILVPQANCLMPSGFILIFNFLLIPEWATYTNYHIYPCISRPFRA